MKKLLGIVVLGLLLSGNGYAEEIYLACGKKNKDKINIVFNNETAFERYKIKKTYTTLVPGLNKNDSPFFSIYTIQY